jgi:hypothetical protein
LTFVFKLQQSNLFEKGAANLIVKRKLTFSTLKSAFRF